MSNKKEQVKLLLNYLLYFVCFIFICFIGISHIFASEHEMGRWTDYTQVLLEVPGAGAPIGLNKDTYNVAGHFTQVYVLVGNISINKDYIYQFEISTPGSDFTNVNAVLVNQTVSAPGVNQTCNMLGFADASIGYPKVYFQCPTSFSNGNLIFTLYNINGANLTSEPQYFKWGYTNFRYYDDVQEIDWGPITSNANQNAQNIINNQNQNTQDIIDNQQDMTSAILSNNYQNTRDIINSNKVCSIIDSSYIATDGYLSSTGGITSSSAYGITDYIVIDKKSLSILTPFNFNAPSINACFYQADKTRISCINLNYASSFSIPSNTYYFRTTMQKSTGKPVIQICENGNQAISDDNKESEKTRKGILAKLGDIFNTLFSDDDADISGLNNMVGWLPPGPVDAIINLPLSFFNALTNTLTGTCVAVSLTLPYVNETLVLPCFDSYMSQYLTNFSTLWTLIGFIGSIFILYHYLLALYKWIDDTLTLRENNLPGYYDDNWGGGA